MSFSLFALPALLSRRRAILTDSSESSPVIPLKLWIDPFSEQVFDLSVELEKAGGDEDLKEAAAWYRLLVQQRNHSEALQKPAPLLEQTGDIKEALYRYRQIEEMIPGKPARSAVLRQAWIYQTGFSKEGREIVPKDPEKAETLKRNHPIPVRFS